MQTQALQALSNDLLASNEEMKRVREDLKLTISDLERIGTPEALESITRLKLEKKAVMQAMYYQNVVHRNKQYQEFMMELESKNVDLPMHIHLEMVSCLKDLECPVCLQHMTQETFTLTPCAHKVCKPCTQEIRARDSKCPICRRKI